MPSFRTTEYIATTHLRVAEQLGLVLHRGAKVRAVDPEGLSIDDPQRLLKWLAPDRAIVTFTGVDDLLACRSALQTVIRSWIVHV